MRPVLSTAKRSGQGGALTGLVSKESLGNGLAIARIRLPSPEFSPIDTIREAVHFRAFQKGVFDALEEGHPWRRLLARVYGDGAPATIRRLFEIEGPDSQEAENLLHMLRDEYKLYSWEEMFFYWIHVDADLIDRAFKVYHFWPMHRRFIELVDRSNQRLLHCHCPDSVDEFQHLCENLGLVYCASQVPGRHDHRKAPLNALVGRVARQEKIIRDRLDFLREDEQIHEELKKEWLKRTKEGEDLPSFLIWAAEQRGDGKNGACEVCK